jgi:cytoskeletal protein RodZ
MGYHSASFFLAGNFCAKEGERRKKEKEKTFMKKFWTLGLAVVLGTALLTGCKKAEQTTTETTTTTEAPAVVEETGTTATSTESTMTTTTTTETTTTATTTPKK